MSLVLSIHSEFGVTYSYQSFYSSMPQALLYPQPGGEKVYKTDCFLYHHHDCLLMLNPVEKDTSGFSNF